MSFTDMDGLGAQRTAHRWRVRDRWPVALRLLVVRLAGCGAGGVAVSDARPGTVRYTPGGKTTPCCAPDVRRRRHSRDLGCGSRRLDPRFGCAPAGGVHVRVAVRRARCRIASPLQAASNPCDQPRPSCGVRHCDELRARSLHDVVQRVRSHSVDPVVWPDTAQGRPCRGDRIARLGCRRIFPVRTGARIRRSADSAWQRPAGGRTRREGVVCSPWPIVDCRRIRLRWHRRIRHNLGLRHQARGRECRPR